MSKKINPDDVIEALEAVCERFKVKIDCRRFTGDVMIYDREGMEVCSFNRLNGHDGPTNLEIGADYIASLQYGGKAMTLQELLEDMSYETRSYSGRGMYGKECLAITVDDPINAVQDIAYEAGGDEDSPRPPKACWDSMGTQYVVYWPSKKFVGEEVFHG